MGIRIHYHGKAKNVEAIDQLIDTVREIAYFQGWRYRFINEAVKGIFEPVWGIGYGYIPSGTDSQKEGIEFFPKMVSQRCNGYFKLFNTKYYSEAKAFLEKGEWPTFFINTTRKGIQISLHSHCGNLNFIFDMKTLELIDYTTDSNRPGLIYGIEGFSCKTQFAGFEIHQIVCKLIKMASHYINFSDIDDESGYYNTGDIQTSQRDFEALGKAIDQSIQKLKQMGFNVKSGNEP